MSKWLGKILCISGILLIIEPELINRGYLENKMMHLATKWQLVLIVIGFFLMNSKGKRKSHR